MRLNLDGNIDGEISSLKLLPLLYVILVLPSGSIFFISGSLYNIGELFLMAVCKFFIIVLYTVTKFTFNLCHLGLRIAISLDQIVLVFRASNITFFI